MINTLCVTYLFNFFHYFLNKTDGPTLDIETQGLSFFKYMSTNLGVFFKIFCTPSIYF